MTIEDTTKILTTIKIAYPNSFKGISRDEAQKTIVLWQELLQDCNAVDVTLAVKSWISKEKFAPTIADVKAKIVEIKENERKSMWEDLYDN